jgi:hypothetical protein
MSWSTFLRRTLAILAIGFVLAGSTGCASMVRGDSQKVRFETDPAGATVRSGEQTTTTPGELMLKRNQVHSIVVAKDGYRTVIFDMTAQWDGASLPGLIVPGGSLSVAADRTSGADLAFYQPPLIKLEAAAAGVDPKKMVLYRSHLLTQEEYAKTLEDERMEMIRHLGD